MTAISATHVIEFRFDHGLSKVRLSKLTVKIGKVEKEAVPMVHVFDNWATSYRSALFFLLFFIVKKVRRLLMSQLLPQQHLK